MKASEGLPKDEDNSIRGNQATLFQLENESCKIKIALIEETYFAYRLLYFHEQKLIRLIQNEYRTSWMEPVQVDSEHQAQALYSAQNFNLDSALVKSEFKNLLKKLNPALIKKC